MWHVSEEMQTKVQEGDIIEIDHLKVLRIAGRITLKWNFRS